MNISNKTKIILTVALTILLGGGFLIYTITNEKTNKEITMEEMLVSNKVELENMEEKEGNTIKENEEEKKIAETNEIPEETIKIAVHIIGEVKKPGIIYLKEGARINDAIEEAGGKTEEADLSQVNLAYKLQDGQKIYIPNKKEKITTYIITEDGNNGLLDESTNATISKGENKKVNINTANKNELDELPGIGEAIAQRIIDYRQENGNFKSIEGLKEVKGIGDAKYEEIKDYVTV